MERADALRPLLPWLSDAKWTDIADEASRRRVVYNLAKMDLRESVPGLVRMLEQDNEFFMVAAADALKHYGAKEAGPALRKALTRKMEDYNRRTILQAALSLGGFSTGEMAQALEAYAAQSSTAKGREEFYGQASMKLDPQVRLGKELSGMPSANDELVARLVRRSHEIAKLRPAIAEQLQIIIAKWPGAVSAAAIAVHLQVGDFATPWLTAVLARRKDLAPEIAKIDGLQGVARGVQAAISSEEKQTRAVLRGDGLAAKCGLLACARLARVALPLATVEPLLDSANARLAHAASLYLVSEDSPAARAAVLRRHPGEALVLGSSDFFGAQDPLAKSLDLLHSLVLRADGPREVFALLTFGTWGDDGQRLVLVYADKTVLRCLDGGGRMRERLLAPEELEKLRAWITKH